MIFRITDIETIPDLLVWTPGEPTYKLMPSRDPFRMTSNGGAGMELVMVEPFPPPHAQRVVAISYVDVSFDSGTVPKYQYLRCYSECRWSRDMVGLDSDEHRLLAEFVGAMAPDVHLVTWNGRTFDLPVIAMRSLKHRIACGWYYGSKDVRYRYSTEGHLDLMDFWADYGATRPMKLHDAARLIGLPGKTDMSGASIEKIYKDSISDLSSDLEGIQQSVARYCLQDSIQTALLWVRSRFHVGKITAESHNAILDTFSANPSINQAITLDWDRLRL
jgi:hypothetical protein